MSLTTLKRKTDGSYHVSGGLHGKGYVNRISSGRPAFSLNDPRRVSAHTKDDSIQTRMRGLGYKGHGGNYGSFIINPVQSSYQNQYDPFDKARNSRPKPVPACPVVQQDYAQYLQKKHTPLPRGKEHYPPMVSRNSTCTTVPNFSFLDFIQRLRCK